MVSVPVYTPAGKFGEPLKLMLNFIRSVRLPDLLKPRIGVLESSNPALAPPNGTVFVSVLKAPPLFEIENADEGMLFPAPSVNATAELAKNEYRLRVRRLGRSVHAVVAVIEVLPALAGLPAVRVKFTALAESVTETDSVSVAFRAIGLAPELSTCAEPAPTKTTRSAAATRIFRVLL